MKHTVTFVISVLLLTLATPALSNGPDSSPADIDYLFAWPFTDTAGMAPRGGTTEGPLPVAVTEPTTAWQALQVEGLDKLERDRRAILAMAGAYRVSFDFLETIGFTAGFKPDRPYRSWGTEYVYVIADEPEFISLQHILVMLIEDSDGELSEPIVTKHWRQDWRYEDADLYQHVGHGVWQHVRLEPAEVEGQWTQAVFQVDDSPRYESIGHWQHRPGYSVWQGSETRRPLPRREFSVRDDYNVLLGTNRHTILPTGWTHEQDNLKTVTTENGQLDSDQAFLAREIGINRYQRIEGFDFSAGDQYWQATAEFWALVRAAWDERFAAHQRLELRPSIDDESMIMRLFDMAAEFSQSGQSGQSGNMSMDQLRAAIQAVFERHVSALNGAPTERR